MTGEGDQGSTAATRSTAPPLVDGEIILQAGVLGLTYLLPVVALRACLRMLHGLRRRLAMRRPGLAPAVIDLTGSR
jgi:hypothetical protein